MKNYFQSFLWINSFKLEKQWPIIANFKDFGMRNLQYDIRIWQKITMKSQWHIIFGTLFYESEFTTVNMQTSVPMWSLKCQKIQCNLWKLPYSIATLLVWPNYNEVSSISLPLCSNNLIENKNNSVLLKPKTEFRFNWKQYINLKFFEFERLFFSKIEIEIFSTI